MIYLIIFIAKLIEVSLSTIRIVFISKGERGKGACIAFFEISLWIVLASNVLSSITEDPLKAVAYVLGYTAGTFLGSLLEEKIAIGIATLNITCSIDDFTKIVESLQELEVGFTILDSCGQKDNNKIFIAYIPRKRKKEVLSSLNSLNVKTFITTTESAGTRGGYGLDKRR